MLMDFSRKAQIMDEQEQAQEQQEQEAPKPQEKTYTDAYVKARIDKANKRHAEAIAAKDDEIAELKAQASEAAKRAEQLESEKEHAGWLQEASKATGVDASLLRGETQEEIMQHAQQIAEVLNAHKFEPTPNGGAPNNPTKPTKEEILAIPNRRERQAAIAANLEQFTKG